ncbi:hypothetical protein [Kordia zhangzhouensis]|uniref:hypothetical protein n=1 Tax=Kordia zhangzhouensis TaxID=1620405 RepID=UPI0012F8AA16|nr:hypothetical protein [Kordia zhangzhouensis]
MKADQFTRFKIRNVINNDDWYEDITEYYEYVLMSLGSPAIGYQFYHSSINSFIKNEFKEIPKNKKQILLIFLDQQISYNPKKTETNFNRLFAIYQKWLKYFPFELEIFGNLKSHFSKSFPIMKEKIKGNRYLGMGFYKIFTEKELIEFLGKKTKEILSLVDTTKLIKEKRIDLAYKTVLDIKNKTHELKQKTLLDEFKLGEKKYIPTIKKWLENEKSYFKSIKKELKEIKQSIPTDKPKKTNKEEIKAYTFKEIFTVNDYEKYINALHQVENPVIDENWNFTGKQKGSKGVVCNWIKDLQTKGIISGKYNRQILAEVCNNEIKDFNIGKDGKTFDNFSPKYNDNYKDVLLEIVT